MTIQREIRRKAFHVLAGITVPALYYLFVLAQQSTGRPYTYLAKWILFGATAITLTIDIIRLRHLFIKIIFIDPFGPLLRRHEISALTGATHLMISALLCFVLFRDGVAIAAMCFLVIGDSLAAIVGRHMGQTKFFEKSFEGGGAGLAGCLLIGALIVNLPHLQLGSLQMAAGAVAAIVVEMLPIPMDDNIRIPLVSGAVMQLLFR